MRQHAAIHAAQSRNSCRIAAIHARKAGNSSKTIMIPHTCYISDICRTRNQTERERLDRGDFMELKTFAASLGAGMALGAAAILMMPRDNTVRKAMQKTADAIEDTVEDSVQRMKHC
jgi:hypothetical protein